MHYNVFEGLNSNMSSSGSNVFAEFLQTKGLYDSIEINESNIDDLIALIAGKAKMSVYCPGCKEMRVFSMNPISFPLYDINGNTMWHPLANELQNMQNMLKMGRVMSGPSENPEKPGWMWSNWQTDPATRIMVFSFVCAMDELHHLDYVVTTNANQMTKIGQFPSIADLTFPELDVYKKVMSTDDRKEFGRAIGLFASGIGAGSYVYLRRILERLLMRAKENASDNIDQEAFGRAHVGDKITMLKDYLPATLTNNPTLYGILSKGIHELSENDCVAYFPVVKECIFMILDEWEDMRKKAEKEGAISAELSKIASKIT